MTWGRDFRELADDLEELAEKFEARREQRTPQDPETGKFVSPQGRFDPKNRIASGISTAMREDVVPDARRGAKRHVPAQDARTIQHNQTRWNQHFLYATSDLVKYHEFGTSTRASDPSKATINAPSGGGYVIPRKGYDNLPFGPDQVEMMDELNFQFVVHPGVEGQHFMQRALDRNLHSIEEAVADELDDVNLRL